MTLAIREAQIEDALGIAKIHVDTWRSTYRGAMPDALLASLSYEKSERMWRRILEEHGVEGFINIFNHATEHDRREADRSVANLFPELTVDSTPIKPAI